MALIKTRQTLEQRIHAPHVRASTGPVCMTCGRIVDSESLVEGEPGRTTFARVLVKHHGAEELRTFEMDSIEWDERELASHMSRANWFDPRGGEGLGVKIVPIDGGVPDFEQTEPTVLVAGDIGERALGRVPGRILGADGRPVGGGTPSEGRKGGGA